MNRRPFDSKPLRLIALNLIFTLVFLAVTGVLSASEEDDGDPPLDNFAFTVGIFDYEPGTAEGELSELILNDLWSDKFLTEEISRDAGSPFEILRQRSDLDFFITIAVAEEESPTYTANVYSQRKDEPETLSGLSQVGISSDISKYIREQATDTVLAESEPSTPNPAPATSNETVEDDPFLDGLRLYRDGEYEASIDYFRRALDEEEQWITHFYLYRSYKELENSEKQWEHLERGLELDGDNERMLLGKANLYFREQDYDEAIPIYRDLVDSAENGPTARFNLSLAYERVGEYEKAKEILVEDSTVNWGALGVRMQNQLFELEEREASANNRTKQVISMSIAGVLLVVLAILSYALVVRHRRKSQGQPGVGAQDPGVIAMKNELLHTLNDGMNNDELRQLSFELGLDWENLSGDTKKAKAMSLIEYFSNRKAIAKLQKEICKLRPDLVPEVNIEPAIEH